MDTLYIFGDNITHYKTESDYFLGLMNSATELLYRLSLNPGPRGNSVETSTGRLEALSVNLFVG